MDSHVPFWVLLSLCERGRGRGRACGEATFLLEGNKGQTVMKTDGGYLLNLVCPRGLAGTCTGCWVLVVRLFGGVGGGVSTSTVLINGAIMMF